MASPRQYQQAHANPAGLARGVPVSDPQLRDEMLSLLLRSRAGVVAGSVCSIVVWLAALFMTDWRWPIYFILADVSLTIARWTIASDRRLTESSRRAVAVGRLMFLSIVWALLLGIGAGMCIASGHVALSSMSIGVAAGAMGVATFRNAPTPWNAHALILCVSIPLAVGGYASGGPLSWLWVCQLPWCATLLAMIQQNHAVIKDAAGDRIELRRIARTDWLTGLENRLAFDEHLRGWTDKQAPVTLLYLDLDDFKQVNDSFGHAAGDAVLVEVARRVLLSVRNGDRVFRLGGDEFAIVIADMATHEIEARVQQLISRIARPVMLAPNILARVGLSVGISRVAGSSGSLASALRAADEALYQAKAEGKGRYVSAAPCAKSTLAPQVHAKRPYEFGQEGRLLQ